MTLRYLLGLVGTKGKIVTSSIKEAIRITDTTESIEEYILNKCKCNYEFIDTNGRDVFQNEKMTLSMIACLHGFNHCRVRDAIINNYLTEIECPRCSETEYWEHVT